MIPGSYLINARLRQREREGDRFTSHNCAFVSENIASTTLAMKVTVILSLLLLLSLAMVADPVAACVRHGKLIYNCRPNDY